MKKEKKNFKKLKIKKSLIKKLKKNGFLDCQNSLFFSLAVLAVIFGSADIFLHMAVQGFRRF